MSRITKALNNDFTALCFLRDELALQISLLQSDLKDRWAELETRMDKLREHMGRAEVAAGQSADKVEASTKALIDSLREGYNEIGKALRN